VDVATTEEPATAAPEEPEPAADAVPAGLVVLGAEDADACTDDGSCW
jgi:hypothetical protein